MNCNDFELKITDLARNQLSEASARERAIAHAAECRRCAARLRDEQRLTAGLRELAATFAGEQMPAARGEAQLLAAFRAEHRTAATSGLPRRYLGWAAAAAVIVMLVALVAARFIASSDSQMIAAGRATQQPGPGAYARGAMPGQNATDSPINGASAQQANAQRHSAPTASANAPHKSASKAPRGATMAVTRPPTTEPVTNAGDEPPSEIATSFIALDGGHGLARPDSLQMVRVELPRSALVSFGLPMNVERADERIKADLLVGDDGVARAIRFVR